MREYVKYLWLFVVAVVLALSGCGGGASGPATPTVTPVAVEFLDGATGVDAASSFQYDFTSAVDSSTVTAGTFFIVAGTSADIAVPLAKAFDSGICNVANAIPATITASSDNKMFTLTPSSSLSFGTSYTVCLTTDIKYSNGTSFEGVNVTFTTQIKGHAASVFVSSVSPVGNDLAITSTIAITFSGAVSLDSLYNISIAEGRLTGSWSLSSDSKTATFMPTTTLPYCENITVDVPASVATGQSGTLRHSFTTLYTYNYPFTDIAAKDNYSTCWQRTNNGMPVIDTVSTNGLIFQASGVTSYNAGGSNSYFVVKKIPSSTYTVTLKATPVTSGADVTTEGGIALQIFDGTSNNSLMMIIADDTAAVSCLLNQGGTTLARTSAGGGCDIRANGGSAVWVRFVQDATTLTGYYSADGTTFTQLGSAISFAASANEFTELLPLYDGKNVTDSFIVTIPSLTCE